MQDRQLYPLQLSTLIVNEYLTRMVFTGEGEFPYVPANTSTHQLPLTTIQAVYDDADHQVEDGGFARDNCTTAFDRTVRNAYLALRKQAADTLRGAGIKP